MLKNDKIQTPKNELSPQHKADLIEKAEKGNDEAMEKLRPFLKESPFLMKSYGDIAGNARRSIINAMAGKNLIFTEAVTKRLEDMQTELAGPNPSPLELLLIERILSCWLEVYYYETLYAQHMNNLTMVQGDYYQRRQDRAHRRYMSAMKTLAVIRKLGIPTIQVNIAEKQINTTGNLVGLNGDESNSK